MDSKKRIMSLILAGIMGSGSCLPIMAEPDDEDVVMGASNTSSEVKGAGKRGRDDTPKSKESEPPEQKEMEEMQKQLEAQELKIKKLKIECEVLENENRIKELEMRKQQLKQQGQQPQQQSQPPWMMQFQPYSFRNGTWYWVAQPLQPQSSGNTMGQQPARSEVQNQPQPNQEHVVIKIPPAPQQQSSGNTMGQQPARSEVQNQPQPNQEHVVIDIPPAPQPQSSGNAMGQQPVRSEIPENRVIEASPDGFIEMDDGRRVSRDEYESNCYWAKKKYLANSVVLHKKRLKVYQETGNRMYNEGIKLDFDNYGILRRSIKWDTELFAEVCVARYIFKVGVDDPAKEDATRYYEMICEMLKNLELKDMNSKQKSFVNNKKVPVFTAAKKMVQVIKGEDKSDISNELYEKFILLYSLLSDHREESDLKSKVKNIIDEEKMKREAPVACDKGNVNSGEDDDDDDDDEVVAKKGAASREADGDDDDDDDDEEQGIPKDYVNGALPNDFIIMADGEKISRDEYERELLWIEDDCVTDSKKWNQKQISDYRGSRVSQRCRRILSEYRAGFQQSVRGEKVLTACMAHYMLTYGVADLQNNEKADQHYKMMCGIIEDTPWDDMKGLWAYWEGREKEIFEKAKEMKQAVEGKRPGPFETYGELVLLFGLISSDRPEESDVKSKVKNIIDREKEALVAGDGGEEEARKPAAKKRRTK